ncbi:TPA: DUF559 domain-containing protein, partial [Mannheimia haemolytica]|nr:DUF559 domain-containing protein [Mannheimia haemolytica]
VIELDGSQHLDQQNYDNLRTHFLNGQGFRVLRFWNNQIHSDLEAVLDTIFYEITRG